MSVPNTSSRRTRAIDTGVAAGQVPGGTNLVIACGAAIDAWEGEGAITLSHDGAGLNTPSEIGPLLAEMLSHQPIPLPAATVERAYERFNARLESLAEEKPNTEPTIEDMHECMRAALDELRDLIDVARDVVMSCGGPDSVARLGALLPPVESEVR